MLTRNRVVSVAAGLLLACPMATRAVVLTWAMEGTIQTVSDPLGLIGFAQPGGHVTYTFTFDSETPDTNPTPTLATYWGHTSTFSVGATFFPAGVPQADVQRHPSFHANDGFNVSSWLQVDGMTGSVYFRLLDPTGTALTNTALPAQPYDLTAFAGTEFSCTVLGPPSPNNPSNTPLIFYGEINSLYAVPEPASLALLAAAGLALGAPRGWLKLSELRHPVWAIR